RIGNATRRSRESGNAMVEAAFTFLPALALICAIADFGIMLFRWTTLQSAVREGCRYAITFQRSSSSGTLLGQDASIEGVVQTFAMSMVKANDSPQTIFVNYYAPTNLNSAITTGGNVPGNVVEVSVRVTFN